MRLRNLLDTLRGDLRPGTRRSELVRSAGMVTGLKIIGGLLAFVASLLYARALGPHGYGLYSYVIAWTTVLAIPVALGLPQYLVREATKFPLALHHLSRWADRWMIASGSVAAVLLAAAALIPSAAGARWLFVVAAPLPMLMGIASVRSSLLQARGAMARSQWPRLVLAPFLTITALAGLWWWRGSLRPIELMVATTLATMLCLLVNSYQLRRISPASTDAHAPDLRLRDALPFMWVAGLFLLNSRIDLIMLGSLKGAYEAGIYAVASRVAELTSFLMATANMVLAPKIAHLHHDGQHALLRRMVRGAMRRVLFASIPIALILILGARPLLTHFYGVRYADGAIVLQILAASQILIVGSGPLGTLLNMTGHVNAITRNMLLAVAINVILNMVLIPLYGATGAATATGISLVFSRILLWHQVRVILGPRTPGLGA
jgi:O-antigen/teichoic acid export membrane protein